MLWTSPSSLSGQKAHDVYCGVQLWTGPEQCYAALGTYLYTVGSRAIRIKIFSGSSDVAVPSYSSHRTCDLLCSCPWHAVSALASGFGFNGVTIGRPLLHHGSGEAPHWRHRKQVLTESAEPLFTLSCGETPGCVGWQAYSSRNETYIIAMRESQLEGLDDDVRSGLDLIKWV